MAVPAVPAWLEVEKGLDSCQHSSVETPSAADMAVRLR